MKIKYITLASLFSAILCSSIVLASNEKEVMGDLLSEKPPVLSGTFSKGRKPDPKWARPLLRQKTVLPWGKMTPEHRPAPKNPLPIPVSVK